MAANQISVNFYRASPVPLKKDRRRMHMCQLAVRDGMWYCWLLHGDSWKGEGHSSLQFEMHLNEKSMVLWGHL